MLAITRPDELFARMGPDAVALQLVRFRRTRAALAALNVVADVIGEGEGETDSRETGFRVMATRRDGSIADQCEVFPADGAAVIQGFDRCMRAAWQRRMPLAANHERTRLESWDPNVPLGADVSSLDVAWARGMLTQAGFQVTQEGRAVTVSLDRVLPASSLDVALRAPAAAVRSLKVAGLSLSALKAKVSESRAEARKGTRVTLRLTLDPSAISWELRTQPASETLAAEGEGTTTEGRVSIAEVTLLSFDLCQELRAFGPSGSCAIPLPKGAGEGRAIKHALLAHAAGLRV